MPKQAPQTAESSFSSIYRALRLLGTASLVTTGLTLIRNKGFALFLGPSGFGLLGLLQSLIGTAANLGGLGVGYGAIRMIARARSRGRPRQASVFEASFSSTGRRLATFTALGTAIALLLWNRWQAAPLTSTQIVASAIGAGLSILASVAVTRLQTRRATSRLALVSILAALFYTALSIPLAAVLGDAGIAIIAATVPLTAWLTASFGLPTTKDAPPAKPKPARNRKLGIIMVRRGIPFMAPGFIDSLGGFSLRLLGAGAIGLASLGQVYAALALSAFVSSIVMSAMNQDFLPRMSEAISSKEQMYRLASEQLLVTVNFAAPVLLLVCAFSHELTRLMFSAEFVMTATMVPVMALLVLLQIAVWPIQTMQTALGLALQQVIGTMANLTSSIFLVVLFFEPMVPHGFAAILVIGMLVQLVVQGGLLWKATGIRYRARDWVPLSFLAITVLLYFAGHERWPVAVTVGTLVAALAWTGLAVRHYLLHGRKLDRTTPAAAR